MRRVLGRLLTMVALFAALAMPGVAFADVATDTFILATEADAPPVGLDPAGPNDEDNAFAPTEFESNYLWGAAVGLLVLTAGGFALLGGLYYAKVVRPNQTAT